MGYRKIPNLYSNTDILDFQECFALEKVDGTSTHITYRATPESITYFSGGARHEQFIELFDEVELLPKFRALGYPEVTIWGEGHGAKVQGMSGTYGKELRFIAFEVKLRTITAEGLERHMWLPVPEAEKIVLALGLEFVPYERGPATLEWVNSQRDLPSEVAVRRGITEPKMREGVVLRPIREYKDEYCNRIMAKHKRDEFRETRTPREVNPDKLKILSDAKAVADEWVVPMRLQHVLDKLPECTELKHTGIVIKAMVEDVKAESGVEIVWSAPVEKALGKAAARLYKQHISKV